MRSEARQTAAQHGGSVLTEQSGNYGGKFGRVGCYSRQR